MALLNSKELLLEACPNIYLYIFIFIYIYLFIFIYIYLNLYIYIYIYVYLYLPRILRVCNIRVNKQSPKLFRQQRLCERLWTFLVSWLESKNRRMEALQLLEKRVSHLVEGISNRALCWDQSLFICIYIYNAMKSLTVVAIYHHISSYYQFMSSSMLLVFTGII